MTGVLPLHISLLASNSLFSAAELWNNLLTSFLSSPLPVSDSVIQKAIYQLSIDTLSGGMTISFDSIPFSSSSSSVVLLNHVDQLI
jgi:hypothetical protein